MINQLLYLVLIFVEMELLQELKNVKMEIIYNMMDVLIVNINVKLHVQSVYKVNVLNVLLLVGILIQQLLLGNVRKDVEIN